MESGPHRSQGHANAIMVIRCHITLRENLTQERSQNFGKRLKRDSSGAVQASDSDVAKLTYCRLDPIHKVCLSNASRATDRDYLTFPVLSEFVCGLLSGGGDKGIRIGLCVRNRWRMSVTLCAIHRSTRFDRNFGLVGGISVFSG